MSKSTTITDNMGDTLKVETVDHGPEVYVTVKEADKPDAMLEFNDKKVIEVAKALLAAVGQQVVDLSTLKAASTVSFNEGMLRLAAIHKRTVEFRYAKDKGNYIEARRLNPEKVDDEGLHVNGHDPDRDAPRVYRLDRIKGEVRFA